MPVMKQVIDLAKDHHMYGNIRIIVGGASVSGEYAREIGADAYCFDAANAVDCVKQLLARG